MPSQFRPIHHQCPWMDGLLSTSHLRLGDRRASSLAGTGAGNITGFVGSRRTGGTGQRAIPVAQAIAGLAQQPQSARVPCSTWKRFCRVACPLPPLVTSTCSGVVGMPFSTLTLLAIA